MEYITAKDELNEYNIIPEYNALSKLLKLDLQEKDRLYKQARCNILKYIITCVEKDPINGNYYDVNNHKLLKEAGELLYKEGGMRSMMDDFVWVFIPKRYQRTIDCTWNGIGEWQS